MTDQQVCGEPKRGDPDVTCDRPAGHEGRHHYPRPGDAIAEVRPLVTIHAGLPLPVFLSLVRNVEAAVADPADPANAVHAVSIAGERDGSIVVSGAVRA